MTLLSKIAVRNLFRHKGRSITVGLIILTGAFFMVVGNGMIAGMEKGMDKNIVKGILGDVLIMSQERQSDDLINSLQPLEAIEKYREIEKAISAQSYVDHSIPQVMMSAAALGLSFEQISSFGVNPERYRETYGDNITIVEGERLKPGERGILINVTKRERIYSLHGTWLLPENGTVVEGNLTKEALSEGKHLKTRNDLVLLGESGAGVGTDLRVPIKGIFRFKNLNILAGSINIMDLETSRECMGYLSAGEMKTNLSETHQELLRAIDENPDTLFSEDTMLEARPTVDALADPYEVVSTSVQNENGPINYDEGTYNIAMVILKPGIEQGDGAAWLNEALRDRNLDEYVRAVPWKDAMSSYEDLRKTLRIGLMILISLIYLSAVLMIANTLSMAAVERIDEIGTMRTVGAQKGFIARMFAMETSLLSVLFGGLGMLLGIAAVMVLAAAEIPISEDTLQMALGGERLSPLVDLGGIGAGIIQLAFVTIIAMIYPILVARRINPIDAIRQN